MLQHQGAKHIVISHVNMQNQTEAPVDAVKTKLKR